MQVAVCFLWHCPASHLGLPLAITLLCEVRTFLDSPGEPRPPGQLVRPNNGTAIRGGARSRCRSSEHVHRRDRRPRVPRARRAPASTRRCRVPGRPARPSALGNSWWSWPPNLAQGGASPWSTINSVPPGATAAAARRSTAVRSISSGVWKNCADTRSKEPLGKRPLQVVRLKIDAGQHPARLGVLGRAGQCGGRHVDRDDLPAVLGQPDGVGTLTAAQIQRADAAQPRARPRPAGR